MKNEKIELLKNDLDYRKSFPNVRGGWTKPKIEKQLKKMSATKSEIIFEREIAKYDNPEEFASNLFYHGSGKGISNLKPSIVLKGIDGFGGGSGEKYYGISLSVEREIASNFTGNSSSGSVAPVLIKRGSVVEKLPNISDANELDEIIEDLWNRGVDAVVIGDHTKKSSEQEVVVLNPSCAVVGNAEHFSVFQKKKMPSFDKEKIKEMWVESSSKYKELSIKSWDNKNKDFKVKYGREMDVSGRWNSKQQNVFDFHQQNLLAFNSSLGLKDFVDKSMLATRERPKSKGLRSK